MKTIIAMLILGLCLSASAPMIALAQGGFPTTAILDDFNRADEGPPPSANWTSPFYINDVGIKVVSDECAGDTITYNDGYWSATSFGPDSEAYCTITTLPGDWNSIYLAVRLSSPAESVSGYELDYIQDPSTDSVYIARLDDGVWTQLGEAISQDFAAGDSLGFGVISSTLTAYRKPAGGEWEAIGSRSDATNAGAGYIGLGIQGTTGRVDNFGGGSEVAPAVPFRLFLPILFRQVTAWPSTAASQPDRRR